MKGNTLVIMAAGLGSRFGGIKQLTPVGPGGEIIMEYSIYDAIQSGFSKVIFIIRKDIEKDFKETIGNRIAKYVDTEYVFQDINLLPDGYQRPAERTKPWGTGQALLTCEGRINSPFCVINADDYYGKEGFQKIHDFLTHKSKPYSYCMAGFILGNTLSEFGAVTRGVCKVNEKNMLVDIRETSGITKDGVGAYIDDGKKTPICVMSKVSMNMWGFTPDILLELKKRFPIFLNRIEADPLKSEYLLPNVVEDLLKEELCEVSVLETPDRWFGVTYQEDTDFVIQSFHELVEAGIYPEKLFS